jgi:hypothetical protein
VLYHVNTMMVVVGACVIVPVEEMSRNSGFEFEPSVKWERRSMIWETWPSFNLGTNADKLYVKQGLPGVWTI